MNALKVVLVEDSVLLQEMMVEELGTLPFVNLVGVADGEAKALDNIASHHPDLVIIDLELVEGSGLGVLEALDSETEKYGSPQKVVFTNHTSTRLKSLCEQFDLDGYFDKSYQLDELTDYINCISSDPI